MGAKFFWWNYQWPHKCAGAVQGPSYIGCNPDHISWLLIGIRCEE